MKTLSILKFRFCVLLVLFVAMANEIIATEYASVLAGADWHWQTRGDVEYGWASFDDLYGNPQRVSIARYQ